MKTIKLLTIIACTFAWMGVASYADTPAACCEKAKKAGKECDHKCCVEAAKAKKVCEKCGGKTGDKKEEKK